MSYWMEQIDQHFSIPAEGRQAAFDALRGWERRQMERYPQFAELRRRPLGNAKSLKDTLCELSWEVEMDNSGAICEMYFEGDRLGDEDEWLDEIAPYVAVGSYLTMRGEDGFCWRWYFDGSHCTTYEGKLVFPDMPND